MGSNVAQFPVYLTKGELVEIDGQHYRIPEAVACDSLKNLAIFLWKKGLKPLDGLSEKRRETRFEINCRVALAVMNAENLRLDGRMTNFSNNGMRVQTEYPLPWGAPIRVNWDGLVVLGKVVYCKTQHPNGCFVSGVQLSHERWWQGTTREPRFDGNLGGAP